MTSPEPPKFIESAIALSEAEWNHAVSGFFAEESAEAPAFFLETPGGEIFFAWGACLEVVASGKDRFLDVEQKTRSLFPARAAAAATPPWCGGFSFFDDWNPRKRENPWRGMPNAVFFLPRLFLHLNREEKNLTGTVLAQFDAEAFSLRAFLAKAKQGAAEQKPDLERAEESTQAQGRWQENFAELKRLFALGKLKKAVLSQSRRFGWSGGGLGAIWSTFSGAEFPNAYRFGFLWRGSLFFGASPEPILLQSGNTLSVPAVAGTYPRGKDAASDMRLGAELLDSPKERGEHAYVVDFIRKTLAFFPGALAEERPPELLKLGHIQHLFTPIEYELSEEQHPLRILAKLHPTPAMCGTPSQAALDFLAEEENHERGYYASPIGFFYSDKPLARFIVGIRSALAKGNDLHVFAGAGIVESSDAGREWGETEQKMKTILQAFAKTPE